MEPANRRRWVVLLAALGATVAATLYRGEEQLSADTRTQAPVRVDRTRTDIPSDDVAKPPVIAAIPERLQPRQYDTTVDDAFTVKSWAPPPPPPPLPPKFTPPKPVAVVPPPPSLPVTLPAPTAPPLPYKYLGRYEAQGSVVIFLGKEEHSFAVKPGETLEGNYRLDTFQGNVITFTYLPMQQQQTLPVPQPN
jgi:hypothetical protein